jgi:uncharacterized membrane protein YeiH
MELIYSLDLIGTFVFAVSGALSAANKKLDLFGAFFTGFITAVGGGTIRDVVLGNFPVAWIQDSNYLLIIGVAVIFTFLFKSYVMKLKKTLFLFDTIGIAVFTIIGMEKAISLDIQPILGILMGVVTAVMGGVLRDTFCNDIPLIFRKEIYATACVAGAILFLFLKRFGLEPNTLLILTILFIILIRLICIRFKVSLPVMGAIPQK